MAQEKKERTDRRIRKTEAQLLQSLMTLMQEKDIKDISVKELSDLADINRGTFYLHYRDVYDMLSQVEDSVFQEFNDILDKNFAPTGEASMHAVVKDIFSFLDNNRLIARTLLGPHGDLAFVNRMKEMVRLRLLRLRTQEAPPADDFDYYYAFITSGCIGLIQSWLNRETPEPPDRIASLVEKMILQGLSPMLPAPIRT
ncbi:MAG TPA: TetR/AcrR family transcriptional regulator [Candidatus Eisenbergiella stercoravium]|nr:TetR/AcrR family transcriptional regulator [Candidatus Eisenbergiella stercoravium]